MTPCVATTELNFPQSTARKNADFFPKYFLLGSNINSKEKSASIIGNLFLDFFARFGPLLRFGFGFFALLTN